MQISILYTGSRVITPESINQISSRAQSISALLLVALFGLLSTHVIVAQPSDSATLKENESGRALAAEIVHAAGGDRWNSDLDWNISFDFVSIQGEKEGTRYSHRWDRAADRYVVSGKTKDGRPWQVEFSDLSEKVATPTIAGAPPPDSLRDGMLQMGYGRFINDSYWFMMPLKLLDSGVHHARLADTTISGTTYNLLTVWFDGVGLTPGDRYLIYVEPGTKLVRRWKFQLQGGNEGEYIWDDYQEHGPLRLAHRRISADGKREIRFDNVSVEKREGTR